MKVDYSFPRQERLTRTKEFEEVFQKGRLIKNEFFNIYILKPNNDGSQDTKVKFGIVVSKKIKKAVKRNRIKRLLRETCRLNKYKLLSPVWIVIVAKEKSLDLKNYSQVNENVISLFKKAKIIS